MRFQNDAAGIDVHAISGTHVVMLAMNANSQAKSRLLGFAIHRTDKTESEQYWMKGMRTFWPPRGGSRPQHALRTPRVTVPHLADVARLVYQLDGSRHAVSLR